MAQARQRGVAFAKTTRPVIGSAVRREAPFTRLDTCSKSFPGRHTSVAMLTALHQRAHLGAAAFACPVLIAPSCLFTKRHYMLDLPFGALPRWLTFHAYGNLS